MAKTALWEALESEVASTRPSSSNWRPVPVGETLRRARRAAAAAGVTRLADVTGLDWLGVPVYQAVRPGSRNMSVALGKGFTRDLARASALMEAVESYAAEEIRLPATRASLAEMASALPYDPRELAVARRLGVAAHGSRGSLVIDWVPATSLEAGEATFVPRGAFELDFTRTPPSGAAWFDPTSNGLASGNTPCEAVIHALCELIERHEVATSAASWLNAERCVDLESVRFLPLVRLLSRLMSEGATLRVFERTGALGVPCFDALLWTEELGVFRGLGCHFDPGIALSRAVLESAQARLAHVTGSRDDLWRKDYETPHAIDPSRWPAAKHVPDWHPVATGSLRAVAAELVRRIQGFTGAPPLALDLTRPELGVPVVFVGAPGLRGVTVTLRPAPRARPVPRRALLEPPARAVAGNAKRVCLFLGPTLPVADAILAFDGAPAVLDVRAPVAQGDLFRLLGDPPDVVALVDGVFLQSPAVLHKEILALVARGVRVLGASSMGALRAAELAPFGVEGVGEVFEAYARGDIDGDDEVAVVHEPGERGFAPMSEALVNVRAWLRAAALSELLPKAAAAAVVREVKRWHFTERTAARLHRLVHEVAGSRADACMDRLAAANLKRHDALRLLQLVAHRLRGESPWPSLPRGTVLPTKYSAAQEGAYAGALARGFEVPDRAVLAVFALTAPQWPRWYRDACWSLIAEEDGCAAPGESPARGRALLSRLSQRHGSSARDVWRQLGERRAEVGRLLARRLWASGRFQPMLEYTAGLLAFEGHRGLAPLPRWVVERWLARRFHTEVHALGAASERRGFAPLEDEILPYAALLCRFEIAPRTASGLVAHPTVPVLSHLDE